MSDGRPSPANTDDSIKSPRVEYVIVTYRSANKLRELLPRLDDGADVVVADNSANVDGIREIVAARPGARYLDAGGIGFAAAANLGARTSRSDVVVFLNPDVVPTPQALAGIVEDVWTDPRLAGSAAMPALPDGSGEMGAGGWEPSLRRALVHAVGLHKFRPRGGLFARPAAGRPLDVDWATGACLAVRTETFRTLGCFDEDFYVYNEDMAFGRSARENGLSVVLRTDLPVGHSAGGSGAPSGEMLRLRGASMARYLHRFEKSSASTTVVVLVLGSALRGAAALARGRRALAAGYLAYARGLVSGRAYVGGRRIY